MIYETIITTRDEHAGTHIAPMGIRNEQSFIVISPFRPSSTLDRIVASGCAVVNFTDDVRIFAGCLTGRAAWPTVPAATVNCHRLQAPLSHVEAVLERVEEDPLRPRLYLRETGRETHSPFRGFNRAQAAVIEAAILVSRLHMLPSEKIESEMQYLSIAIDKTAGSKEREAWGWLQQRIAEFRKQQERKQA